MNKIVKETEVRWELEWSVLKKKKKKTKRGRTFKKRSIESN